MNENTEATEHNYSDSEDETISIISNAKEELSYEIEPTTALKDNMCSIRSLRDMSLTSPTKKNITVELVKRRKHTHSKKEIECICICNIF